MENIVIATIKSWNIENAKEFSKQCRDYEVYTIVNNDSLEVVHDLKPRYIFLPHWSWKIPKSIYDKFECVAFHMADLPYGRGGSPLQNLIIRGIYNTAISAFRIDDGIDTGPIYLKEPFDISEGSAQELYEKASKIIFGKMIPHILREKMIPIPQSGEVLEFKRRTPEESNISKLIDARKIYDFIRMLDAEGYPRAFINHEGKKIVLFDAKWNDKEFMVDGRYE